MAGHSHWAGIKHKKALIDNKRGKVWSKCSKAIIIAAQIGGGDPDQNPRFRLAISDAKSARMPKDTIARAIKKGTGELAGGQVEEVIYEGYGPGGIAIMCEILTDNRNRTAPEVRKLFEIHNGKLGGTGCVAWKFHRKGLVVIPADQIEEDALFELALEAGAEDVKREGDKFEVICEVDQYADVCAALEAAKLEPELKQVTRIPESTVDVDVNTARKALKLMNLLDDHDDVQSVAADLNVTPEVMAALENE